MVNIKGRSVLLLSALVIGSGVAWAIRLGHASPAVQEQSSAAPLLRGNDSDWINLPATDHDRILSLKGHVTVLHFWTFECINCEHNLPMYNKWAADYKPADVQLIGVHTPELPDERDPVQVRNAVKRDHILYPVVIDGDSANWTNYHQEYWPTVYLIDKKGQIRKKWEGELGDEGRAEVTRDIEILRKE